MFEWIKSIDTEPVMQALRASVSAAKGMLDLWPIKLLMAAAMFVATNSHAVAFFVFCFLIVVDLGTKQLALSYTCAKEHGCLLPDHTLWDCYQGISLALEDKYIKSERLRSQFAGKLLLYLTVNAAAIGVDWIDPADDRWVLLAWGYFGAGEFVSILENLRDSGCDNIGALLDLARKVMGNISIRGGLK